MRWRTAVAIVIVLLVAACGDDTPTAGAVTIETEGDLTSDNPAGSFEVTEGAEILDNPFALESSGPGTE